MNSNIYKNAKLIKYKGKIDIASRSIVTKSYVDGVLSNPLSSYTLDDIFDYYGIDKIENHLRKMKLKRIYKKDED